MDMDALAMGMAAVAMAADTATDHGHSVADGVPMPAVGVVHRMPGALTLCMAGRHAEDSTAPRADLTALAEAADSTAVDLAAGAVDSTAGAAAVGFTAAAVAVDFTVAAEVVDSTAAAVTGNLNYSHFDRRRPAQKQAFSSALICGRYTALS
jgi:hypothetical protein